MAYSIERMPERISIGRETETGVTDVMIDCGAWVSKWPGMELHAIHTPEGGAPYILQTETDGDVLVWHVTDADTATPGTGRMEIVGEMDGRRKVSAMVKVSVAARMNGTVGEPPEAAKPWADRVVEAAERITGMKVQAETLAAGISATAAWDGEHGLLTIGVPKGDQGPKGEKGPQGEKGEPGKDAVVDATLTQHGQAADAKATGDALAGKLTEPSSGLAVGKYFRIAAIDENGHAVLDAVDAPVGGLSTEPSLWPAWTSDEQAAARERMGLITDTPFELVGDVTTEEAVAMITLTLSKPCRCVSITFAIPPESTGNSRNVYFSADANPTVQNAFCRCNNAKTSEVDKAVYKSAAQIIGHRIFSFGGISAEYDTAVDYQQRGIYGVMNGFGVLEADCFSQITVLTYGANFPDGSRLQIYGC